MPCGRGRRPLSAPELSDGTLQYQLLTGAMLSADKPGLVELEKVSGETRLVGRDGPLDQPSWQWPRR